MGKVAIEYVVMPDSVEANLHELRDKIINKLQNIAKIQRFEEKPIAFGLRALHLHVIVDDVAGISEKIERSIGEIAGVQSVESITISLI